VHLNQKGKRQKKYKEKEGRNGVEELVEILCQRKLTCQIGD
jgi:hypothetical protein